MVCSRYRLLVSLFLMYLIWLLLTITDICSIDHRVLIKVDSSSPTHLSDNGLVMYSIHMLAITERRQPLFLLKRPRN